MSSEHDEASDTSENEGLASAPEVTPSGKAAEVPRKKFLQRIPVVGPALGIYTGYSRRNGPLLSAGLAYYALFAAGPLVILTLQVASLIVGPATAKQELSARLQDYLGTYLAGIISDIVVQSQTSKSSTIAWAVGAGFLLWAGIRLFMRLQVSFNIMWDVRVRSREFSFRRFLSRMFAFAFILVPAVLYLGSLFLSATITWLEDLLGGPGLLLSIVQAVLPLLMTWVALLLIYVILPDVRLSWRDCWLGSLAAAVGCAVGSTVFGAYLVWAGNQKYAGSAGAFLALIVWADFLALFTLLGVRLNKAIYEWRGKVIEPYPYAALITELPDGESTGTVGGDPTIAG